MATKNYGKTGLFLVLAALMLCRVVTAQLSCSGTIISLASCMNYVTGNTSTPSSSCCTSLANVVQSQPQCLCPLLNNNGAGSSLGISINQTLALALPAACNVQTPPVSQCNAVANEPAGAPAPAPLSPPTGASTEPPQSPTATATPSVPSGSKTVPGTSGGTSDGNIVTISSVYLTVVTPFIAAWMANINFHF